MAACVFTLVSPMTAGAGDEGQSVVDGGLLEAAKANQDALFSVIVQGDVARAAATFSAEKSDRLRPSATASSRSTGRR